MNSPAVEQTKLIELEARDDEPGQPIRFVCRCSGSRPAARLQWRWSGRHLEANQRPGEAGGDPQQQSDGDESSIELRQRIDHRYDGASLTCVALNDKFAGSHSDRSLVVTFKFSVRCK